MTHRTPFNLLRAATLSALLLTPSVGLAVIIGFEAEDGSSVTTTATATIGSDYAPAQTDGFALGGEYLTRTGNGGLSTPDSPNNVLSYDVNFADAGEYDLYARVLFEIDGSDDSFYYGNGFGAKDPTASEDWIRPNGLPDASYPAATYFWINLSEDIGAFGSGTPTTFTVATPGVHTIQFGGREDGLYFDAFAFGTAADSFTDQQLTESVTNVFSPPNQWGLPGGGSFNTGGNWTDAVVPVFDALLADSITEDAVITLDAGASLNSVTFNNGNNSYTLAGPNSLELVAAAQVSANGSHSITAGVSGSAGLTKLGLGVLNLSGAKSYTGATNVQEGTLAIDNLDAIDNQASGVLSISAGAAVDLSAGASGTLAARLTGASTVDDDAVLRLTNSLDATDTVTIDRSNAGFGGVIRVNGGVLAVANSNALGDGGEQNDRTVVQQGSTARVALTGGVTIASEVLDFEGRATNDAALSSTGANAWNGVIRGEGSGAANRGNIESTSGTLTLDRLFAEDTNEQFTYVFSGAGDTTVTGRISDANIDIDSDIVTVKQNDNVGVTKRGSGTLTIGYATTAENDYWFGPTAIEEGTMVVNASGGTDGELRSSSIAIHEGATFDISAYTQYTQQIGQDLRGGGSINVGGGNLRLISDGGDLSPGDAPGKVGELTVSSGSVSLTDPTGQGTGAWTFDVGNNAATATDVLNVQSGAFTASTSALTVNVAPANGHLDAGSRTIVTHTGGTTPQMNSATARITDADGNPLTARQTVAISGATSGQINVVVTGEEQSRTWTGGVSDAWDVSTSNWTGGDQQFRDLDHVTFNDSAASTSVTLAENRAPGSITFANSTAYTFGGEGGIVGSGPIDVTGSGEVTLGNAGNNFSGATTIQAGSSLRLATASTGSITNSGTLSLGVAESTNLLVQDGSEEIGANGYKVFAFEAEEFQSLTENAPGDTTWVVRNDIAGSLGGEALYATEDPSNTNTSTSGKNFTTYNMQFTEPGSYMYYFHAVSTDGGNPGSTPDGDAGNDDSFYTVTGDMDSSNTDPTGLGSRIDNFGSARLAAEGVIEGSTGSLNYDWYRNGDSGGNAGEFHRINVTQSDVDAGTVFKFKVGTREGGMTLDKFVFVADADYGADPNFGTLTDLDLDGAVSVTASEETFIAAGTRLDIDGDFTMTADSVLNMAISTSATHDQLNISGALTADGTLYVAPGGNGFSAAEGDVFDLFAFDSFTGSFTIGSLPSLSAGLGWDTSGLDGVGAFTGALSVISVGLPGDFNGDNVVDAADYTVWRDNLGATEGELLAGNGDGGVIGQSDYDLWVLNYGASLASTAQAATPTPEPTALAVAALVALPACLRRRRA